MANANRPSGLAPVGNILTGSYNGQTRIYFIASTDGNAFAIGDPVKSSGDADTNGVAGVTLATAGAAARGVIVSAGGITRAGFFGDPTNLNTTIIPATKTKGYYVAVVDDPFVIFEMQEINSGTPFTSAEVGLNANFVAGANNGFLSGFTIDNTTEAGTATLNVKLLGLAQRSDNAYGLAAKWLVLLNSHELRAGTAGV